MNIIISHHYSYWNAGDTAITLVLYRELKKRLPNANLIISSMDYIVTKKNMSSFNVISSFFYEAIFCTSTIYERVIRSVYVLISTLLWSVSIRYFSFNMSFLLTEDLKTLMAQYQQSDIVIAQGGGYLISKKSNIESFATLLFHGWGLIIPKILGKKVILHNQSIGPFSSPLHSIVVKWFLSYIDSIFVREKISHLLLQKMNIPRNKLYLTTDAAFSFVSNYKESVSDYLEMIGINTSKPIVGVTVKDCLDTRMQAKFEEELSKVIVFLASNGKQVICIPQCTSQMKKDDDREVLSRIKRRIGKVKQVYYIFDQKSPDFLQTVYEKCTFLLATRMHSAIFSLHVGTPVIALSYDPKHSGIMENLHLQQWVIPVNKVTYQLLLFKINDLQKNMHLYKEQINKEIRLQHISLSQSMETLVGSINLWYNK